MENNVGIKFVNDKDNIFFFYNESMLKKENIKITKNGDFKYTKLNNDYYIAKNNYDILNGEIVITLREYIKAFYNIENCKNIYFKGIEKNDDKIIITAIIDSNDEKIEIDQDKILKKYNYYKKEGGILKYKICNLYFDLMINSNILKKSSYELKNYEIGNIEANLEEAFLSIKINLDYISKTYSLSDSFIGANLEKYIEQKTLQNSEYGKSMPLLFYNDDGSYDRPITKLSKNNITIEDLYKFMEDNMGALQITKLQIIKNNLFTGKVYTGSETIVKVKTFLKIKDYIDRTDEIVSEIVEENKTNFFNEDEEYSLTFNCTLSGNSERKYYKILEVIDSSIYSSNNLTIKNNGNMLEVTNNDEALDNLRPFLKNPVALVLDSTKEDYNSSLTGLINNLIYKYTAKEKEENAIVDIKENATKKEAPTLLDEKKFYNHIAGSMPKIEVTFIKKTYENNKIKTKEEKYITGRDPYIKSMSIVDNGVKKLKLSLWDKDFGSFNSDRQPLEQVIREAIANNTALDLNKEGRETENDNIDVNSEGYLKIRETDIAEDTTNLKIRFGFDDYNIKYKDDKRNARAWEIIPSDGNEKTTLHIFDPYKKLSNDGFVNVDAKNIDNYTEATDLNIGNIGKSSDPIGNKIVRKVLVNDSEDQTTMLSVEMEFMIVGFKTNLQKEGVYYEIEAIETNSIKTINYSILQRYEDITGTPKEVLYMLMRMFNESADGKLNKNSPKIYWADTEGIVEEINEDAYKNTSLNIPEIATDNTINKKISISLGGQNAYYNYNDAENKTHRQNYYKNIGSLISEFCAACPPKKENIRVATSYIDQATAETVTINNTSEGAVRPLQWYSKEITLGDGKKYPCIFLYYKKLNKINKIRRYNWGPGIAGKNSVILDLQIENANEFAVMSAVNVFNLDENKNINYLKNGKKGDSNSSVGSAGKIVNRVTGNEVSDAYETAYMNCLYQGNITILGDPFYTFDSFLQPCSYPIYLNIEVPVSEYELRKKERNNIYFNEVENNVRKHYLSGYYVVKSITHNITGNNFTTTLEIMSYPGIENDLNIKIDKVKS